MYRPVDKTKPNRFKDEEGEYSRIKESDLNRETIINLSLLMITSSKRDYYLRQDPAAKSFLLNEGHALELWFGPPETIDNEAAITALAKWVEDVDNGVKMNLDPIYYSNRK